MSNSKEARLTVETQNALGRGKYQSISSCLPFGGRIGPLLRWTLAARATWRLLVIDRSSAEKETCNERLSILYNSPETASNAEIQASKKRHCMDLGLAITVSRTGFCPKGRHDAPN